jgi:hypothetical protein
VDATADQITCANYRRSKSVGAERQYFWREHDKHSKEEDEDELGLIDRRYAPPGASGNPGGAIMHWQVDDVSSAVDRLVELGATGYQPVTKREAGFVTASVVDPFGNILGLMYSPHFIEMHDRR